MRKILIVVTLATTLGGCAFAQKALRTLPDIAHHACLIWGEDNAPELAGGLGLDGAKAERVAQAYCDYEENVRPFLDNLLAAEQLAAERAGISKAD